MPPQRPLFALGLRTLGALAIATMFALVKLAGESGVALPETMFWRQVTSLPIIFAWLAATGRLADLRTDRPGSHFRRGIVGMIGMLCNFASVTLLPLAEATTLSFTAPLFAVLIAGVFLRERIGRWRWSSVIAGFAGVLVIAQPGHVSLPLLGALAGLASGLLVAVISFLIRDLGRTETSVSVVFWFAVSGTLVTAAFMPFFASPHTPWQWALLFGVGIAGTIGQLLLTASLRIGAVASVIVMDYTALIWATGFGWLIWDTLPPPATWIGAPLIILAGVVIAYREHRLARAAGKPSDPPAPPEITPIA